MCNILNNYCIFTTFKKEISILSHIEKKLQAQQYNNKTASCSKIMQNLDFLPEFLFHQ